MAQVTGLTAAKTLEVLNSAITGASINGAGQLILTTHSGGTHNLGVVKGVDGQDATALLNVQDTSTVDMSLSGAGTVQSPWLLQAAVAIATATVQGLVELATDAEATAGLDTTRAVTPAAMMAALAAGVQKMHIPSTQDVSLTSTEHPFQIGLSSGQHVRMDQNEMFSSNNGVEAPYYMGASLFEVSGEVRTKAAQGTNVGSLTRKDYVDSRTFGGYLTITPSAANTPTGANITFPVGKFTAAPSVTVSANTTVPGTVVTGTSVAGVTTSGCTVYLTRTSTTATGVYVNANVSG